MKFKHIGLAFGDGGKINKYLAVLTRLNRQFTLLIIRFRVDTSETHFHKSTLSTLLSAARCFGKLPRKVRSKIRFVQHATEMKRKQNCSLIS